MPEHYLPIPIPDSGSESLIKSIDHSQQTNYGTSSLNLLFHTHHTQFEIVVQGRLSLLATSYYNYQR